MLTSAPGVVVPAHAQHYEASASNTGKPWLVGFGKLKMDRGNLMKSSWKKFTFFLYDNVIVYKDRDVCFLTIVCFGAVVCGVRMLVMCVFT